MNASRYSLALRLQLQQMKDDLNARPASGWDRVNALSRLDHCYLCIEQIDVNTAGRGDTRV
jgi:hypothetical protein